MIKRGRFQNMFDLADEVGSWDERLVAPPFADPQVAMSHGADPQPFFLVCEKDTLVVQYTGESDVDLRFTGTRQTHMEMGDMLYVPAGTPCRIVPREDSIYARIKAINPGLEGVSWFCPSCDVEVWRYEFDANTEFVQQGYLDGCQQFNADAARRTCRACQAVHAEVDISGFRWAQLIEELRVPTPAEPTELVGHH